MTQATALRLEGVFKRYRAGGSTVNAVDGIDLSIEAGSSVAIVGPSGCGKSTLLGMLGGLETPSSGRVWLDEMEISARSESERAQIRRDSIGFVFQSYDLLPFLTAEENIEFQQGLTCASGTNGRGGNNKGQPERSADLIRRLGLAEHATKLPDQLSGGQRQRVGIARALAHSPRLILGDEPTGELDSETSSSVLDLLLEAQQVTGATLVIVTHDADVAARLERVVTLRDGKVVSDRGTVRRA